MADPVVPNFNVGVGRLATDRFTYEGHVNGSDDRHLAGQIDLFPTVVIGSEQSTVQDAISAISLVIGTPPADASTTVKGIVKLAGDIAGTATSVTVTKIQGKPISTLSPSSGDVLTWDGSVWKPQSISGTFTNLTVTGNTTLGTNSGNTLVVNAQTTLSNNLNVNGNTVLGNANSDSTTIQGSLTVSGAPVSITGATGATFAATGTLHLTAGLVANLTGTTSVNVSSGTINITGSSATNVAGGTVTINPTTLLINSTTSMQGSTQQASGFFSVYTGATFYIFSGVTCTIESSLIMSGNSKINKRHTNGPNSTTDIYPAQYDVYYATNITAARQWTINETTIPAAVPGFEFEVINYNSTYGVTIYSAAPAFGTLAFVAPQTRAVFYRGSSNWQFKYKTSITS